jgi:hypothetical protein
MLCCSCCGNVFANEVADPAFVCDLCDAERREAYLEEMKDAEDDPFPGVVDW